MELSSQSLYTSVPNRTYRYMVGNCREKRISTPLIIKAGNLRPSEDCIDLLFLYLPFSLFHMDIDSFLSNLLAPDLRLLHTSYNLH